MSEMCQERSGFLFAHDCDWPAQWSCERCGKRICERHTHQDEQARQCITCSKQQRAGRTDEQGTAGARDPYVRDPYWYATSHYPGYYGYDADDYGAFDTAQGTFDGDGAEGDPLGS